MKEEILKEIAKIRTTNQITNTETRSTILADERFLTLRAGVSNALNTNNASMEHVRATMSKDLDEYCKFISICTFEGDIGIGTLPCTSRWHYEIWTKLRNSVEGFKSLRKDSTNSSNSIDNPLRKQILNWIGSLNDIIFDKGYRYSILIFFGLSVLFFINFQISEANGWIKNGIQKYKTQFHQHFADLFARTSTP